MSDSKLTRDQATRLADQRKTHFCEASGLDPAAFHVKDPVYDESAFLEGDHQWLFDYQSEPGQRFTVTVRLDHLVSVDYPKSLLMVPSTR
jgi:hypothetical protein